MIDLTDPLLLLGSLATVLLLIAVYRRVILGSRESTVTSNIHAVPLANNPYTGGLALLTPDEIRFFRELRLAFIQEFAIAPKLRLADIVGINPSFQNTREERIFKNRILQKRVDFALLSLSDGSVSAVIELERDDFEDPFQVQTNSFKDQVLRTAGIPTVRFIGVEKRSAVKIRKRVMQLLKLWEKSAVQRSLAPRKSVA